MRTLTVRLQADISSLSAGLGAGAAQVKAFGNEVTTAGASTTQSTDKLARGFLIAGGVIAAALVGSVAAAAQFEASMRNVATISTYVGQNFDATGQKLIEMSNRLPQSANELAKGLYDVASSGFAGREGLVVLEGAAKAASAGLSDTATSGRAITGVLNAYGLTAKDTKNVSDVLFQTVNLGVVTFGELAQNLGDVVGLASQAKIPIKDVGTAIATITLAGVPAAEATTSLNRVIQQMIVPSDALIERFHAWGFASGEAALSSLGLQGIMLRLKKETGGSITAFQALFPEIRSLRGALALTAADGENYIRVSKGMDDATKGQGATQKALNEQAKSLSYQFNLLKNQVTNLAIGFGGELLPALKVLGAVASGVVGTFSDMPGPLRSTVAILAVLAAGLLLVGGSFLLVASRVGRMRAELLTIGPAGERLVGVMGALGRSLALAGGIASLAYGFAALDGSLVGTVTGVLSLVTAVSLLRPGIAGMQSGLGNLAGSLSNRGFESAAGGVLNLGLAAGRLNTVLPTLAISGAVMASTMDSMGEASVGGAVNMASMAATAGQLGFVVGGPVGAAIGATAGLIAGPLITALTDGGQSLEQYRAQFEKLAATLDRLGTKQATSAFIKSLGMEDAVRLFAGDARSITSELEILSRKSPDAARKVVAGLKEMSRAGDLKLTAKDIDIFNAAIDRTVSSTAKQEANAAKATAANAAIKKAHQEVGAAAGAMSTDEQAAADAFSKAVGQISSSAVAAFPTVKGAFEQIQSAAAQFGVDMDPAVLLAGFQEKLKAELDFGRNVTTVMQAGFTDIGLVIAQQGPEKGAKVAEALAAGIKSGDTVIAGQLNDTAKLMTAVPATLEGQFSSTWGPALVRGQQAALDQLRPVILNMFGVVVPQTIEAQIPFVAGAGTRLVDSVVAPWTGLPVNLRGLGSAAGGGAAAGLAGEAPAVAGAASGLGAAGTAGAASGLSGIPGAAGAAGAGAAGALGGQAPAVAGAGTTAGQAGTTGLDTGLSGMAAAAALQMGAAGGAMALAAIPLAGAAVSIGQGIGAALSSGIAAGISGNAGVIAAAARGAVQVAEDAASAKAERGSPSKLFARLGADLAAGVAVGITGGFQGVREASAGLVNVPSAGSAVRSSPAAFGASSAAATGRVVYGSRSSSVQTTIQIGGNLYGDHAARKMLKDSADARDRKLANDLRRRRE